MKSTKKMIPTWMIKKLHVQYRNNGLNEEQRRAMLMELTDGRTDSTKDLTYSEAQYLSGFLNGAAQMAQDVGRQLEENSMKRMRSAVLKRLQQIGIDTTDWDNVNAYLSSKKIAGKPLYNLSYEELQSLIPKLESIKRKRDET